MVGNLEHDNYADDEAAQIVSEARRGGSLNALHCPGDRDVLGVYFKQFRGYDPGDEVQGVVDGRGQDVTVISVECPTCGKGRAHLSLLPLKPDRKALIKKLSARGLRQLDAEDIAGHVVGQWQPGPGAWVVNGSGGRYQVVRGREVIYDTPSQITAGQVADALNEVNA